MAVNFKIDRTEVFRLLGSTPEKVDADSSRLVDDCIAEARGLVNPKYTYRKSPIERTGGRLSLSEIGLELPGENIAKHLENSDEAVVMAATVGSAVEDRLRILLKTDVTRAATLDAAAGAAVEGLCDAVQEEIAAGANERGRFLTTRYSPGYGDLPLTIQPEIVRTLDTHRKIGLSVTDTFLLVPRKSVTALIGLQDEPFEQTGRPCRDCKARESCEFLRKGLYCGR